LHRYDKLAFLGLSSCLLLTSCSPSSVKANIASPDACPFASPRPSLRMFPWKFPPLGTSKPWIASKWRPRVPGQIKAVAFTEGQNVSKGQLRFTVDPEGLRRQAAEQQAELERDAAIERQTRAVVARAAAAQKQSESEADIAVKLGNLGVISGQRVNQLVTTSDTAHASLR
jgi:membrane fusion protein, multidrug efflux system